MNKDDEIICRCEEVTRKEIIEAIRDGRSTVSAVKKQTRAGMGACQGRTCSRLIARILVEEGIRRPDEVQMDTPRTPAVPVSVDGIGEEL